MKVVVDTNVLISAILKDKNPEAVILFIAERPDIEWIASTQILAECKEVIDREKFGLSEGIKGRWLRKAGDIPHIFMSDIKLITIHNDINIAA